MFFIPKYQRAYAWEAESVEDFIKDLKNCFEKRNSNIPINHFFGGVLCVRYPVAGAVNQNEYEIIDGQQRISTFTLLVSCLIEIYKGLLEQAKKEDDENNKFILQERIKRLSERFIEFRQEVQRQVDSIEVMKLSRMDHPFYKELIRGMNPSPSRDSHEKINYAYKTIYKEVNNIVSSSSLEEKMDKIEIIQNIIDNDFTILYMVTDSKEDAFRLFQVINDRGTNLTVGDLLKAKTLEILEDFKNHQDSCEKFWDNILADPPSKTEDYLNWIYASYKGKRAKQDELFDVLLDGFFPSHKEHKTENFTECESKAVYQTVKNINEDIEKCRKLREGQWLYNSQQPITNWDRTRLNILLKELEHTLSIPLFLAASKLDHRTFSEIVQVVEKVFFRYKIICNQHATALRNIYYAESLRIREDTDSYETSGLKQKLNRLIATKASDSTFENGLKMLEYKQSGGSNKPLKYYLMTAEYYCQWYLNGAKGTPLCTEKNRIYDFAGTSIEHLYPKSAKDKNEKLEPLKHKLGNLTILDPSQNSSKGNEPFEEKISMYQQSSVKLTNDIAKNGTWTEQEFNKNQDLLIDIALKVFVP
ncbi:DUF262 domain-containing protein [Lusitaniella coriacea LEGE 07157]|uniref:DUF262 domain-containing protein n=2 Tax=Lusitaniella TaxID=1983104 RepID=A0A8J7DX53_9CYAN|nr:DUF262 domain-containing protein [Lusitaniella coriacea LEGE 07157]